MAYALVGAAGAASVGAVNTAVTPAWDAGASRSTGSLLLCFVSVLGSATAPTAPSGWNQATQAGTSCGAYLYYKNAAGGDAAPTINAIASGVTVAHLEEWSGRGTQTSSWAQGNSGVTSPRTSTLPAADAETGWLLAMVGSDFRSAARTPNDTWTSNHGTPTTRASNDGVSSANHYSHATAIMTSNAGADTATMTCSVTTSITGLAIMAVSFKAALPVLQTVTLDFLDAAPDIFAPDVVAVSVAADQPFTNPYPPLLAQ